MRLSRSRLSLDPSTPRFCQRPVTSFPQNLGLRVSIEEGVENQKENAIYHMLRECTLKPVMLFASCAEGTDAASAGHALVAVS